MDSWLDIERRFRDLAPALKFHRLDDQTGAAGEWWRVAGEPCQVVTDFELLCELAGEQLAIVLKSESEYADIVAGNNVKWMWYRMLKKNTSSYKMGSSGYEIADDGTRNWIYTGSLNNIGESAANLALWLNAKYPLRPKINIEAWYKKLYRDYGKEILIGVVVAIIGSLVAL
ncbi:hypothetical protein [Vibrio cholerae]|uniref:hypothetical protein n=1 Tax=Vibrio cholerae TaxID=666 RepID=UPI00308031FF